MCIWADRVAYYRIAEHRNGASSLHIYAAATECCAAYIVQDAMLNSTGLENVYFAKYKSSRQTF